MYTATNTSIYIFLHMMILSSSYYCSQLSLLKQILELNQVKKKKGLAGTASIDLLLLWYSGGKVRRNTNSIFISVTEWIKGQCGQISKTISHAKKCPGDIAQRKSTCHTCIRLLNTEKKKNKSLLLLSLEFSVLAWMFSVLWVPCVTVHVWEHITLEDNHHISEIQ